MKIIYLPYYVVKKNDTLESISKKFNVPPTQILIENYLTPNAIKEGTVLSISKNN